MVLWIILASVAGAIFGAIGASILHHSKLAFGTLKIDRTNPEKDIYRFDIKGDLVMLPKKKQIVMDIDPNADLTQD